MVKGMLIKDIIFLKTQKMIFLIAGLMAAMILVLRNEAVSFGIAYIMVMCAIVPINTIAYDEQEKGYLFLFSMPVTRKGYVQEKYLLEILVLMISWVVITGLGLASSAFSGGKISMTETFMTAVTMLIAAIIMMSIFSPVQFRFGTEKRQIIMFILIFGGVLVAVFAEKFLQHFGIDSSKAAGTLQAVLANLSPAAMMVSGIVFAAVCMAVSYFISVRIMQKKEL